MDCVSREVSEIACLILVSGISVARNYLGELFSILDEHVMYKQYKI